MHTIRLRGPWQVEAVARYVPQPDGSYRPVHDGLPPTARATMPADWSGSLGADFLVTHPGSARGDTVCRAIQRCVESLKRSASGCRLNGLMILMENTAGQGTTLGGNFEGLAEILAGAGRELPVGACIDTAHCFQAGYPVHRREGLARTIRQLDATVGLEHVRLIHANDSKTNFASHSDRHEHIGKGRIGREAFGRIVRHPKLRTIPFICETPVDRPGDDRRNLRIIRQLAEA